MAEAARMVVAAAPISWTSTRVPGAEGDEDRRGATLLRIPIARAPIVGLWLGCRRPVSVNAARAGGRVACMSRRRTAAGRSRSSDADVASSFGEADVHRHGPTMH